MHAHKHTHQGVEEGVELQRAVWVDAGLALLGAQDAAQALGLCAGVWRRVLIGNRLEDIVNTAISSVFHSAELVRRSVACEASVLAGGAWQVWLN